MQHEHETQEKEADCERKRCLFSCCVISCVSVYAGEGSEILSQEKGGEQNAWDGYGMETDITARLNMWYTVARHIRFHQ